MSLSSGPIAIFLIRVSFQLRSLLRRRQLNTFELPPRNWPSGQTTIFLRWLSCRSGMRKIS